MDFTFPKCVIVSGMLLSACCGCGHPAEPPASPNNSPSSPTATNEPLAQNDATPNPQASVTPDQATPTESATSESTAPVASGSPAQEATSVADTATVPPTKDQVQNNSQIATAPPKASGTPMPSPSIVPNAKADVVTIWSTTAKKTLRAAKENNSSAEKVATPNCHYTFSAPLNWNVGVPSGYVNNNCHLLWPSTSKLSKPTDTRIAIIPWSIYDQEWKEEIKKAEVSWFFNTQQIQSASLTNQAQTKYANYPAICNTYSVVPLDTDGKGVTEMTLMATYVNVKPDCYAVIMVCPQSEYETDVKTYKTLLNSLSISTAPPVTQAPPPDRAPKGEFPNANDAPKPGAKPSAKPAATAKPLKPNMPLPSITTDPPASTTKK